jgi:hypothetical protein
MDKKLGLFIYPKIKGTVVEDLDVNSVRYPLTFFFEGVDNDKDARRFFEAAKETGQWEIIHPVHGFLGLQLMSISENVAPVVSGNITEITTEWIEPIDPKTLKTAAELKGLLDWQVDNLNISAADQFLKNIRAQSPSQLNALQSAVAKVQALSNKILGPVAEFSDAVFSGFITAQNAIDDIFNATVLAPMALAGQLQQIVQLPLQALTDVQSRLSAYGNFNDGLAELSPDDRTEDPNFSSGDPDYNTAEDLNSAAVQELSMVSVIGANGKIITSGPTDTAVPGGYKNLDEAIETAENIAARQNQVVEVTERTQDIFKTSLAPDQFFAQSESYPDSVAVTTTGLKFLLQAIYNTQTERRIVLTRPCAPYEIAITEYGSDAASADDDFELFLTSNQLSGDDILLLLPGREVVVYA